MTSNLTRSRVSRICRPDGDEGAGGLMIAMATTAMGTTVMVTTALVATLLLGGCTTHSVGPAFTNDDFVRKARTTAAESLSVVQTVRLAAQTADDGNAFGPYIGVTVSEQEDKLAEIQGDFDSIQPPHRVDDELRGRVDDILSEAMTHVADVRIAVRRGQLDGLADVGGPLAGDATALQALLEALP